MNKIHVAKMAILFFCLYITSLHTMAQQEPAPASPLYEQQIENESERHEVVSDDDYQQRLEYLARHPIDLNAASAVELREPAILTGWQITAFMQYRKLLGRLISIYELQAIPGWDIETIRRLLPYVVVNTEEPMITTLAARMENGEQSLLVRFSRLTELPKQFGTADSLASHYLGSPLKLMARYKYNYKNLLQFGWTGDKDAGEQFLRGAQPYGFDFNSFHFFARKLGFIKSLAVGDFTVGMGQGLMQWQHRAFKKGGDVLAVKREGPVLRPYSSPGEFNFHRGIGITMGNNKWEFTVFGSVKKLSAYLGVDTQQHIVYVSSLLTSGYHRTRREQEVKDNVSQLAAGATWQYNSERGHAGVNMVHYFFSRPFRPSRRAYDIFSLAERTAANYSVDYSYTFRNAHFFGEAAVDEQGRPAMVNGLIVSADARADISVVHRHIHSAYHSLYSNAFTERTAPANETGFYTGLSLRPCAGLQLSGYADFFRFPWLQYRVDRPSEGYEYLLSLLYRPNRQMTVYGRYRVEQKARNLPAQAPGLHEVPFAGKTSWRMQMSWQMTPLFSWKSRMELSWFHRIDEPAPERGFLYYMDLNCRSILPSLAANIRCQYAEVDSYDARLYAYESDVLFSSSVTAFEGKSWRVYVNLHYSLKKPAGPGKHRGRVGLWLRAAYTKYATGFKAHDKYKNDHQLEFKGQLLVEW